MEEVEENEARTANGLSSIASNYSKKTRDLPNFSRCHRCDGRRHLYYLSSNWRIALLCKECLTEIASAQVCSYCYSKFAGVDDGASFICRLCHRLMHCACATAHHRHILPSGFDPCSFECIDCSPYVKPRGGTGSRVPKAIPDEEVALQLHLVMNGSQRVFKSPGVQKPEARVKDKSVFELTGRIGFGRDSLLDVTGRVEQGSCSGKVEMSCGVNTGIGSAFGSVRRPLECVLALPANPCARRAGQDSNGLHQIESVGDPSRYSKKYSRNTWRLKGVLGMECHMIQNAQMSCSEVSELCSDVPCRPHRTPD